MTSTSETGVSYGQFLLLLDVTGADDSTIDKNAQAIHDAYMAEFGPRGAFTHTLLRLAQRAGPGTNMTSPTRWTHLVRYFGPDSSIAWLQNEIVRVFERTGTNAIMQTFTISDITGRY